MLLEIHSRLHRLLPLQAVQGLDNAPEFSNTCGIILDKHSPVMKGTLHKWQHNLISWFGLFHLMKSLVFLNTPRIFPNSLLNMNRIPTPMEVPY